MSCRGSAAMPFGSTTTGLRRPNGWNWTPPRHGSASAWRDRSGQRPPHEPDRVGDLVHHPALLLAPSVETLAADLVSQPFVERAGTRAVRADGELDRLDPTACGHGFEVTHERRPDPPALPSRVDMRLPDPRH